MKDFCARSDNSALIGAFGVTDKKEASAPTDELTQMLAAATTAAMALPASLPTVQAP